ncbi:hypothetical protein H9L10_03560 [Phycicoccus endophyticus]|uniref:Uncharacterized protein n=1 Tax=Phycicoccus endophyticus TaxID=1690220 RepID=A0A7G9R3H1_9MICO|nr:hypothetical protein [Phycicoccus endophyticus]NHI19902.1 hypothetical protein [Phycicoccus endophyticus]QNN50146.1 hypothetical protein H9L10_03560 [Phycicoccus endophyticus]GGL27636.1 hypothetical protein GCM10012283_07310 [Phycicoccus endophyticus]
MRPVICNGVQYDADKLPKNVKAEDCVPADEWFAQNRKVVSSQPAVTSTPEPEVPDAGTAPVPDDTAANSADETPEGPAEPKPAEPEPEPAAPKAPKRRGR